MIRIGTLANDNQVLQFLQQNQSQAIALQAQISTGLKSQSYAGIAGDAANLIDLQDSKAHHQGFIDSIDVLDTRLKTTNLSISNIESLVAKFSEQLPNGAFNTTGVTISEQAKQLLGEVGDILNSQDGSRFLFAGNQTSTPPFNANGLPATQSLAAPTNGAPPNGYYQGDAGIAQAAIDDNVVVKYGVTAANPAFEQIIRVLNFFATSPTLNQTNATDDANVQQAATLLSDAAVQLQKLQGGVALQDAQVQNARTEHQNVIDLANQNITTIAGADPATAITKLNTLQTQIEASFQTVNVLRQLSLANFLK